MFSLPNDVLIYIVGNWLDFEAFSKLDIAITNKSYRPEYLRLIESNEFIYIGDTLRFAHPHTNTLSWLKERHIKLGKVNLSEYNEEVVELLSSTLSRLRTLGWTETSLDGSKLGDMLNRCSCLIELGVHGLKNFPGWNWKCGSNLRELTLVEAIMTSEDLITIGENCGNLRNVTLMNCICVERSVYPLTNNHFEKLQRVHFMGRLGVNTIEYIIHKAVNLSFIFVDTNIVHLLPKYCPNINNFNFDVVGVDVNDDLSKFLKQCPQLSKMELNCKRFKVSDNCLKVLSETCTKIVELDFDCDEKQLQFCATLLKNLTKLTRLTLRSDGVLECALQNCCPLVESIEIFMSSSQLDRLPAVFPNLVRIFVAAECPCDSLVHSLARYCPNLESVELFMASDVTDESAIQLLQCCPVLSCLYIQSSLHTTKKLVTAIVQYGNSLTELGLSGDNLTASAYSELCEGCPVLKLIVFDVPYNVAYDKGMQDAIDKLREVRNVELQYRGQTAFDEEEDDFNDEDDEDDEDDDEVSEDSDDREGSEVDEA